MEEEKFNLNKIISEFDKRNLELEKRGLEFERRNLELDEKLSALTITHLNLRRGVLEERRISARSGQKKDPKTTIIRNEIAHGGDILGDIKAIRYLETEEWAYIAEYKEDFQQVYTISFSKASEILQYPSEVIRAFDILASIRELHVWQGTLLAADRETIRSLATEITMVAQTIGEDRLHNYFKKNRDMQEKFNELNKLYRKGWE
ncbi:hypothetical protein FQN57_003280 [Myotisia sp. PD_48]|nr:hypothetical protein FQN57_003280 [Myotisia sp. PD_48]